MTARPAATGRACNGSVTHLDAGCPYQLRMDNGDPLGGDQTNAHSVPARPEIALPATTLPVAWVEPPVTLTMPASPIDVSFACTANACSDGHPPEDTHARMVGLFRVDPSPARALAPA